MDGKPPVSVLTDDGQADPALSATPHARLVALAEVIHANVCLRNDAELRHALLVTTPDAVLLERRPGHGIWGGLLSLPELAAQTLPEALNEAAQWLASHGIAGRAVQTMAPVIHGFTHFELHLVPLRVEADARSAFVADSSLHWQPRADATSAALPAPVRRLLDALDD